MPMTRYEPGEHPTACPHCGSHQSRVQTTKRLHGGAVVRRYRYCLRCRTSTGQRWRWMSEVVRSTTA